jgi:hypothetical protein
MSHFAKINNDNIVTKVIVAEQEFFDTFVDDSPGEWIQTSYNDNMRGRYAGIGFVYDSILDAFYEQQPYPSWILNEDIYLWEAPSVFPDDGNNYQWNEETLTWENE